MLNANSSLRKPLTAALLLSCALMLTACATPSPDLPVVVTPPRTISMPAVPEPSPSGAYLTAHCETLRRVQSVVKETPPLPAHCATPGR